MMWIAPSRESKFRITPSPTSNAIARGFKVARDVNTWRYRVYCDEPPTVTGRFSSRKYNVYFALMELRGSPGNGKGRNPPELGSTNAGGVHRRMDHGQGTLCRTDEALTSGRS